MIVVLFISGEHLGARDLRRWYFFTDCVLCLYFYLLSVHSSFCSPHLMDSLYFCFLSPVWVLQANADLSLWGFWIALQRTQARPVGALQFHLTHVTAVSGWGLCVRSVGLNVQHRSSRKARVRQPQITHVSRCKFAWWTLRFCCTRY